jgi:hypothetical protein
MDGNAYLTSVLRHISPSSTVKRASKFIAIQAPFALDLSRLGKSLILRYTHSMPALRPLMRVMYESTKLLRIEAR